MEIVPERIENCKTCKYKYRDGLVMRILRRSSCVRVRLDLTRLDLTRLCVRGVSNIA